jgi:nucleotide-binding universal stress UspA family protein
MTLLCGTDFSQASTRAVEAAARIAARTNRPLHLVHAIEAGRFAEEVDLRRTELAWAEQSLRSMAERAAALGAKVEVHLEDGAPDEVMLELAGTLAANLIVVGALGWRRGGAWQLGSHADRLAHQSHVPVLVVRDVSPFADWTSGTRPLRVMLGADASLSSEYALHWVEGLRAVGPCDVTVVHLYWPPDQFKRLGLHGVRSYLEPDPEVTRALERDLTARFSAAGLQPPKFRAEPHLGNLGDRIAILAREEGADLVVVGSHARNTLERMAEGSVSRDVLHYARVSVACVPAPAVAAPASVPEFRNVLVATDFSTAGNAAVPLAYALAARGCGVHVVHVLPERHGQPALAHDIFRAPSDDVHAKAREQLAKLVPRTSSDRPVFTNLHVLESNDVPAAICQAAERLDASVICLGTPEQSGLSRVLVGSVADAVVRSTRRPVLLAREPMA